MITHRAFSPFELSLCGRYAKSLYAVAAKSNDILHLFPALMEGFETFAHALSQSDDLSRALLSRMLPLKTRAALTKRLMKSLGVHQIFERFMALLVKKNRLFLIHDIARAFEDLVDRQHGDTRALFLSRNGQKIPAHLSASLSRAFKDRIVFQSRADVSLIAGYRIEVGEKVFDASLKHQLLRLKHGPSPAIQGAKAHQKI